MRSDRNEYTNKKQEAVNELLKGDMVMKRSGLEDLINVMSHSGFAVNVVPIYGNEERVRVIITEAKGGFYE